MKGVIPMGSEEEGKKVFPDKRKSVLSESDMERLEKFMLTLERPFCLLHKDFQRDLTASRVEYAEMKGAVKNNKFVVVAVGAVICTLVSALWWNMSGRLDKMAENDLIVTTTMNESIRQRAELKTVQLNVLERLVYIERRLRILP